MESAPKTSVGSIVRRMMPAANRSTGLVSAIAMTAQMTSNATASEGDFVTIAPITTEATIANAVSRRSADIESRSLIDVLGFIEVAGPADPALSEWLEVAAAIAEHYTLRPSLVDPLKRVAECAAVQVPPSSATPPTAIASGRLVQGLLMVG